ncbi:hypothetical protein IHE44_0001387 [Lamprotornis superbus]|uniref:Disintegrin and metalloproteinase domain-containing protein 12 n=1 Tax=Lamprotornis superbus TaxID=245042 RepID=A0A835NP66_9PASS|nr:hypothetical protein IHE44_0001387 [Lamprotornis superbus]
MAGCIGSIKTTSLVQYVNNVIYNSKVLYTRIDTEIAENQDAMELFTSSSVIYLVPFDGEKFTEMQNFNAVAEKARLDLHEQDTLDTALNHPALLQFVIQAENKHLVIDLERNEISDFDFPKRLQSECCKSMQKFSQRVHNVRFPALPFAVAQQRALEEIWLWGKQRAGMFFPPSAAAELSPSAVTASTRHCAVLQERKFIFWGGRQEIKTFWKARNLLLIAQPTWRAALRVPGRCAGWQQKDGRVQLEPGLAHKPPEGSSPSQSSEGEMLSSALQPQCPRCPRGSISVPPESPKVLGASTESPAAKKSQQQIYIYFFIEPLPGLTQWAGGTIAEQFLGTEWGTQAMDRCGAVSPSLWRNLAGTQRLNYPNMQHRGCMRQEKNVIYPKIVELRLCKAATAAALCPPVTGAATAAGVTFLQAPRGLLHTRMLGKGRVQRDLGLQRLQNFLGRGEHINHICCDDLSEILALMKTAQGLTAAERFLSCVAENDCVTCSIICTSQPDILYLVPGWLKDNLIIICTNNYIDPIRGLLARGFTETHYLQDGTDVVLTRNHTCLCDCSDPIRELLEADFKGLNQGHCYYHGQVQGYPESSLLQAFVRPRSPRLRRGIIVFENNSYILEPLEGATSEHKIYRAENLKTAPGSCGHQLDILATGAAASATSQHPPAARYKRETLKTTKYVELVIVADNRERQGKDVEKIKQRLIEIANYVDKFYRPLNIRVALVGVEVWNDMDKCSISQDPFTSLHEFLDWRKLKLLPRKAHDNAQLISGVYFQGTTIGMAPIMSMCTAEQSGGVVMDHSENPLGAAVTLAHELGHNFGMNHDTLERGCNCKASTDKGGCIMNPSTGMEIVFISIPDTLLAASHHQNGFLGTIQAFVLSLLSALKSHIQRYKSAFFNIPVPKLSFDELQKQALINYPFPMVFSSCSRKDLENSLEKGVGMCLFNLPEVKESFGGQKCGNGYVEDGEECDCGEPESACGMLNAAVEPEDGVLQLPVQKDLNGTDTLLCLSQIVFEECTNRCCNATTCALNPGAVCAHGLCCEDCQLKPAGISCRESSNSCDLPEFCTGASPQCPANVYLHDGHACHGVDGYCYNGICQTHEQQALKHLKNQPQWYRQQVSLATWVEEHVQEFQFKMKLLTWHKPLQCSPKSHACRRVDMSSQSRAKPAPGICFERVNSAGDPYGNCGKDSKSSFAKCEPRDAKCGKIQCQGGANRPVIGTNAVSIETNIPLQEGGKILCRGTHVYLGDDMPDPGLVLAGTKCEDGKICLNRRCQNTSVFGVHKCATKCHGRGVCNNKKNCHCEAEWAPPFCDKPGFGGSVDSGPIRQADNKSLTIGVLITILCLIFAGSIMYLKRKNFMRWLFTSKKTTIEKLRSVSPARPSSSSEPNHVHPTCVSKNLIRKPQNTTIQKIIDISTPVKTHQVPPLKTPQRVLPPLPQLPGHQAGPERPLPAHPSLRFSQEPPKPSPPRKPLPADPQGRARQGLSRAPASGKDEQVDLIQPLLMNVCVDGNYPCVCVDGN